MQSFDSALYDMYKQGKISLEQAIKNADSANNLRVRVAQSSGVESKMKSTLSIKEDEAKPKKSEEEELRDAAIIAKLSEQAPQQPSA
jgi:twitching motility protein PilU